MPSDITRAKVKRYPFLSLFSPKIMGVSELNVNDFAVLPAETPQEEEKDVFHVTLGEE